MANTLTNLIPDIYAALDVVSRELVGFIPSVTMDAQANRVAVGQNLRIPIVPGNAAGGATHLHFEIHKNGATDPYLRLKSEFTPAQKMAFLTNILAQTADKTTLAKFIVATYPAQIAQAKTAGIVLPSEIAAQMPQVATAAPGGPITTNLGVGARGSDVVSLQTFLIIQNKGPAAVKLAAAGATGYFGALTQAALAEYQTLAAAGAPAQMTREQIMSKIAQIQALIAELQQQLKLLQTND